MTRYGSIQDEETQQVQAFRKTTVLVFVGVCAVFAVVGLSGGYSPGALSTTVDSNRNKGSLAAVPGVLEKTQEVLNITEYGLRYAIFSFIPCCAEDCEECKIIPTVQGKASADWTEDWQSFTNALPEKQVAAAVYNFEYFVSEDSTETKPVLITWAPAGMDQKDLARAGYYLGSVILATDGVHSHYPLNEISESYQAFCMKEMQVDPKMCAMEGGFHNCPFENEAHEGAEGNPCKETSCDGAAFVNPLAAGVEEGAIADECCGYINDWCTTAANVGTKGCHPTTLASITRLCQNNEIDETPELILPDGEVEMCAEECEMPCVHFSDPNDTWKKCSGCPTNGLMNDEGNVFQCYSGQHGFLDFRCCGVAAECTAESSMSSLACNTLESFECSWIKHSECRDLEEKQQAKIDAAAAAEAAAAAAEVAAAEQAAADEAGTDAAAEETAE